MGRTIRCPRCKELTKVPSLPGRRGRPDQRVAAGPAPMVQRDNAPVQRDDHGYYHDRERKSNGAVIAVSIIGGVFLIVLLGVGAVWIATRKSPDEDKQKQEIAALNQKLADAAAKQQEATTKKSQDPDATALILKMLLENKAKEPEKPVPPPDPPKPAPVEVKASDQDIANALKLKEMEAALKQQEMKAEFDRKLMEQDYKNKLDAAAAAKPVAPSTTDKSPLTPSTDSGQTAAQPAVDTTTATNDGILLSKQDWVVQQSDPLDPKRQGSRFKTLPMPFKIGVTYLIDLKQVAGSPVDPYLRIQDNAGKVLAQDDNSGSGKDARLVFQAPQNATFNIIGTTAGPNQFGAMTLTVKDISNLANSGQFGGNMANAPGMSGMPYRGAPMMQGRPGMMPGGPGMMPSGAMGMTPGAMPGMMPGAMPGMMPGAMPGMMPGAMPGMMPGAMPGMMPGAMPGMAGTMPGMNPQMGPNGQPLGPNGQPLGSNGQPLVDSKGRPITMNSSGQYVDSSGKTLDAKAVNHLLNTTGGTAGTGTAGAGTTPRGTTPHRTTTPVVNPPRGTSTPPRKS